MLDVFVILKNFSDRAEVLVRTLFALLAALQVIDAHSTLTAGAGQLEANRLLTHLARWTTSCHALVLVKGFDLIVIGCLYIAWRVNGRFDREFALCLGILVAVYSVIVINNYVACL